MVNNHKIECSVGILTYNSANTLEKCLRSLENFNEIIVCDGGSTDGTRDIANRLGCLVIHQDKRFKSSDGKLSNFSGVRNQMLDTSKYEWFLYVDSDEYLSKEAVEEISEIVSSETHKGLVFKMPRKYVVEGVVIDCASSYPNYQVRFFNKKAVNRFIKRVHERIDPKEGYEVRVLKHPEFVPVEKDPADRRLRQEHYLQIEIERHKNITFTKWFRWILLFGIRVMLVYIARYVYSLFFCRGKRLPLPIEWLKIRHHTCLIWETGKRLFMQ